jgi:hypothetical protein
MFEHFQDYFWKGGKPYGRGKTSSLLSSYSYKIVVDPYFKRISIEKYKFAHFEKVIYDSLLLDFRHLTLKEQTAWQRELLKEDKETSLCLLRNHEDRSILLETLTFEKTLCRTCRTSSGHGISICLHRMYYKSLHDSFDGVILYDIESRPVMMKIYETDPATGEFTKLLKEEWNMQTPPERSNAQVDIY